MIALVFPFQTELEAFLAGLMLEARSVTDPGNQSGFSKPLRQAGIKEERVGGIRTFTWTERPDWRFTISGQGKVEAALACQILAHGLAPSAYLLVGSACGLDHGMKVGDLVLADPCIEYDFVHGPAPMGVKGAAHPDHHPVFKSAHALPGLGLAGMPPIKVGTVLSADRNVFDPGEKHSLHVSFGALATAWEGAGFHRFLRKNGAKGWELRLITEENRDGRPTLDELRRRMEVGFPPLYPLVELLGKA